MSTEGAAIESHISRSAAAAQRSQTRSFTRWVNAQLQRSAHADRCVQPPATLFSALHDGVTLIYLFEALFAARGVRAPARFNTSPQVKAQKLDNVSAALAMLPQVGIMTVFVAADNVVEQNEKMVLGLVWRLILAKQIVALSAASGDAATAVTTLGGDDRRIDQSAKAALMAWARARLAPYTIKGQLPPVDNFGSAWSDGRNLLALIHSADASLVALEEVTAANARANVERAISLGANRLQVPPLLDWDDVVCERPDEKSIMTYVSEFAYRFELMNRSTHEATLTEREQALAMREAELERQKFLQHEQQERALAELQAREAALLAAQEATAARLSHAAKLEQAYLQQQERDRAERDRLAHDRDALEAQLRARAQADAARDEAEKSFADAAHACEGFFVAENRNIETADTLALLQTHIDRGTLHGHQMMAKVRALDQQQRQQGVVHNRFTRLDVATLDAQWARLQAFMDEKKTLLQKPARPARPASPPPAAQSAAAPPAIPQRRPSPPPQQLQQQVPQPEPVAAVAPQASRERLDPNSLFWCAKCQKKVQLTARRRCVECDKYVI